jgi:carbohydrate kinase (thermoresistant glucokinase family)
VIVFGAAGSGKSTVGRTLAAKLGWPFFEGDELHPSENVARMRAGIPLGDAERAPWLERLAALVKGELRRGESAVLACSALKRRYRAALVPASAAAGAVRFVYLRAEPALLAERLATRRGHFFPPKLLDSQIADLEPPTRDEPAVVVEASDEVDTIVQAICGALRLKPGA